MQVSSENAQVDGFVQDDNNSSAMHWSYCGLALNHRCLSGFPPVTHLCTVPAGNKLTPFTRSASSSSGHWFFTEEPPSAPEDFFCAASIWRFFSASISSLTSFTWKGWMTMSLTDTRKWPTFCKWYFQIAFLQWNIIVFWIIYHLKIFPSHPIKKQKIITGSGNGLAPSMHKLLPDWTNDHLVPMRPQHKVSYFMGPVEMHYNLKGVISKHIQWLISWVFLVKHDPMIFSLTQCGLGMS